MFYHLGPTDLPDFKSGAAMLTVLTDEDRAIKAFGQSPFVRTRTGLRYFLSEDPEFQVSVGEVHRDQCLATFAELGIPLTTPIHLKDNESKTYSVADLLSEAIATFDLHEREPAWTAIALTTYLPPKKQWVNRFEEKTTFSELACRLMQEDLNTQSCAGTHVLEALGLIAIADQKYSLLDESTRVDVNAYLAKMLHEVAERQQPDGGWNKQWCALIKNDNTGSMSALEYRVLVTGHLVGILHEVDQAKTIKHATYARADDWLRYALNSPKIPGKGWWLCPFTHGAVSIREATVAP
jgi:hypothetical protein